MKPDITKISEARKFVFQFFYHEIFENNTSYKNKEDLENQLKKFSTSITYPIKYQEYIYKVLLSVNTNKEEIQKLVIFHLQNWKWERVALIDKAVLLLGVCEMKYITPPTPVNVAINEYVEISKIFGNEKSHLFINGILDKIASL